MRGALLLLGAWVVGCGGKIDGNDPRADGGGGGSGGGGGGVADATATVDGPIAIDAGGPPPPPPCTKAMIQLGLDGMGNCKGEFTWSCGGLATYRVSGGCRINGGFSATCAQEGVPNMKMVFSPMCTCSDPNGLALLGAKLCGFPPPAP